MLILILGAAGRGCGAWLWSTDAKPNQLNHDFVRRAPSTQRL